MQLLIVCNWDHMPYGHLDTYRHWLYSYNCYIYLNINVNCYLHDQYISQISSWKMEMNMYSTPGSTRSRFASRDLLFQDFILAWQSILVQNCLIRYSINRGHIKQPQFSSYPLFHVSFYIQSIRSIAPIHNVFCSFIIYLFLRPYGLLSFCEVWWWFGYRCNRLVRILSPMMVVY